MTGATYANARPSMAEPDRPIWEADFGLQDFGRVRFGSLADAKVQRGGYPLYASKLPLLTGDSAPAFVKIAQACGPGARLMANEFEFHMNGVI